MGDGGRGGVVVEGGGGSRWLIGDLHQERFGWGDT